MALWLYPFLAYVIYRTTLKAAKVRRKILLSLIAVNTAGIIGLCAGISTLWIVLNTIIVSTLYLTVCLLFWIGQDSKSTIIKVISIISMILTFSFGFFAGSVGLLGVAFALGEYTPNSTIRLDQDFVYQEYHLGNALTDYRGKRIKVSKKLPIVRFLQKKVFEKEYYDIDAYMNPMKVQYDKEEKSLTLSPIADKFKNDSKYKWPDIIWLMQ